MKVVEYILIRIIPLFFVMNYKMLHVVSALNFSYFQLLLYIWIHKASRTSVYLGHMTHSMIIFLLSFISYIQWDPCSGADLQILQR